MNKQIYIAPTAETLEVKVEGVICGSGGKSGNPGQAGATWTVGVGGDFYDYGDL